jgi:hypothetical protein
MTKGRADIGPSGLFGCTRGKMIGWLSNVTPMRSELAQHCVLRALLPDGSLALASRRAPDTVAGLVRFWTTTRETSVGNFFMGPIFAAPAWRPRPPDKARVVVVARTKATWSILASPEDVTTFGSTNRVVLRFIARWLQK